jgi:2-polyprenyl-6-hydroxyphenyl methylase / 3-demethylubiquinone-9 3-methyltransferase
MNNFTENVDISEVGKFSIIADTWWEKKGFFRGLHEMNPLRVDYIAKRSAISEKAILDVGCGGGILSEALARRGGIITGIDMNDAALSVATTHMLKSGLKIDYRRTFAESLANESPGGFDIVTCMEVLEHVPDPASLIAACAKLVKPGGSVFISTISKTFWAFLLAILISEYILGLTDKKTHAYRKFIRPREAKKWGQKAGLSVEDSSGILYIPYLPICCLIPTTDVNYIVHFKKFN